MRCKQLILQRITLIGAQAPVSALLAVATLIALVTVAISASAATAQNAQSPLGIELAGISRWSPEMPFLDIMKANAGWITGNSSTFDTGEEKYLNLDSNGWPISLTAQSAPSAQRFTSLMVSLLSALPNTPNGYYPAGQYIVLYSGQGTLAYRGDARLVSRSAGKDVINVATPTSAGIMIQLTATDPNRTGNYINNIRLVKAENAAALNAGQIFNPTFLSKIQNFHMLRFMDWLVTNGSTLSSWSNRPLQTDAFWGTTKGVPIEVAVQVANAVSADAWLNVPVMADDNYITQMATVAHSLLGSTQKVYVEFSNEVWNTDFPQYQYAVAQGQATFASGLGDTFSYGNNWYGMRVAQTCDIWKSVWGSDANRVVCVLAAQAAQTFTATSALKCSFWTTGAPCAGHGIDAVAIAPYFGGKAPAAWTSQADGGLTDIFAALTSQNDPSVPAGGWLSEISRWEAAYVTALAPYHLPLVAYESGQGFVSFPNGVTSTGANTPLTNLYIAANRDPRMGTAYATYYQQWKANGGQLMNVFSGITPYSQYGEWGALESVMQTTSPLSSAPPKWQAIQNFISGGCWWTGCTSALAKTPESPTNLTVH
ncbi:MAG: cellulose-binding protein [Steroidobacteraceae bacterium]|jgi:hypothetical protein